jgi:NAD-dependent deacetylase
MKPKLVVLSGAGISAESGIKTFREGNGLWEEYNINEVATPEGWKKNNELVLGFYNKRRKQVIESVPNKGHETLVSLEKDFDVNIITQNIDDLHERAGSSNVLHLHGEIRKSRSTLSRSLVYEIEGADLNIGDVCENGAQLRPHIVWFGEEVPEMENASLIVKKADVFIVVGTSMNVYPAAGLIDYVPKGVPIYLIDPNDVNVTSIEGVKIIKEKASIGLPLVVADLLK